MFENVKVGDSLYDVCFGWGRVKSINRLDYSDKAHFIEVDFTNMKKFTYSKKGKNLDLGCTNQTLFWDEVKIEAPEKPFDLEEELRKLEVVEFKNEYNNYFIYWSNNFQAICLTSYTNIEIPMIKYFSKESAYNFKKSMNNKNITKEQFFSAYKKVFGGID